DGCQSKAAVARLGRAERLSKQPASNVRTQAGPGVTYLNQHVISCCRVATKCQCLAALQCHPSRGHGYVALVLDGFTSVVAQSAKNVIDRFRAQPDFRQVGLGINREFDVRSPRGRTDLLLSESIGDRGAPTRRSWPTSEQAQAICELCPLLHRAMHFR